LSVTDKIFAVL